MEEQKFLRNFIKDYQGKMNLALLLEQCFFTAGAGAAAALLAEITAFLIPFYHADLVAGFCLLAGVLCGVVIARVKRYGMKEAALAIDRFGFEERIVTAYENLDREDWVLKLQRDNAAFLLKQNSQRVKKKLLPSWKRMFPVIGLCLLTLALALIPTETKELARMQHELVRQAQDRKEEIKDALEALENIDAEGLTEDQIAQIEAMKDSLNASMTEMQEIASDQAMTSGEMAAAASAMQQAENRLNYKMDQMANQLGQMAQQAAVQNGENADRSSAESLQAAADQMSGGQNGDQDGGNRNGGQSSNQAQGSQNGQSQSGNQAQGGQNGQSQSGNQAQGNQNGGNQNGAQDGSGQDGEDGGNGNNGNGGGLTAGTGTASYEHDYVSVPNALGNDESLHGNSTQSEQSDYYKEQNGIAWEGERVTYESVIGEYANQAYEGLEQGRYPSGMTDVIKEYFGNLQ